MSALADEMLSKVDLSMPSGGAGLGALVRAELIALVLNRRKKLKARAGLLQCDYDDGIYTHMILVPWCRDRVL